MSRKQFRMFAIVLAVGSIAGIPSCGLPQQLDAVSVQPSAVHFLTPVAGATANLKAYGFYLHPVATKDVTSQVVWTTDADGLVTVAQDGVITTVGNCGVVDILASITGSPHVPKGQVYVGRATITVIDTTDPLCPQN
jgi:hypothetical protein